jgi:hypothetical protein
MLNRDNSDLPPGLVVLLIIAYSWSLGYGQTPDPAKVAHP